MVSEESSFPLRPRSPDFRWRIGFLVRRLLETPLSGLKEIYVARRDGIYLVDRCWDAALAAEIFNGDSIVVVDDNPNGSQSRRLGKIFSRETTRRALDDVMRPYWDLSACNQYCNDTEESEALSVFRATWDELTREYTAQKPEESNKGDQDSAVPAALALAPGRVPSFAPGAELDIMPCRVFIKWDIFSR